MRPMPADELLDADGLAAAIAHYREHGYARLGKVCPDEQLGGLRARADAVMLGEIVYPGLFFQHDTSTGVYYDLAYGKGWQGPSLAYRKIEKLEKDPLFSAWLNDAIFRRLTAAVIGPDVVLYRALLMNKGAQGGTHLPFHQDGGKFWGVDRDPQLQVWTALDDAPEDAGCVEVVPGSHRHGLATAMGGVVPTEKVAAADVEPRVVKLPAKAGEVLLLHNHLWHRSGVNTTGHARKAFTVCYMDAATRCLRTKKAPRQFVPVFADVAHGERTAPAAPTV